MSTRTYPVNTSFHKNVHGDQVAISYIPRHQVWEVRVNDDFSQMAEYDAQDVLLGDLYRLWEIPIGKHPLPSKVENF